MCNEWFGVFNFRIDSMDSIPIYRPDHGVMDDLPNWEVSFLVADSEHKRKRYTTGRSWFHFILPPEIALLILGWLTDGQLVFVRWTCKTLQQIVDHLAFSRGTAGSLLEPTWREACISLSLFRQFYNYLDRTPPIVGNNGKLDHSKRHPIVCRECWRQDRRCHFHWWNTRWRWIERLTNEALNRDAELIKWLHKRRLFGIGMDTIRSIARRNNPEIVRWLLESIPKHRLCMDSWYIQWQRVAVEEGNLVLLKGLRNVKNCVADHVHDDYWPRPNGPIDEAPSICAIALTLEDESVLEWMHSGPVKSWPCTKLFDIQCIWAQMRRGKRVDDHRLEQYIRYGYASWVQ